MTTLKATKRMSRAQMIKLASKLGIKNAFTMAITPLMDAIEAAGGDIYATIEIPDETSPEVFDLHVKTKKIEEVEEGEKVFLVRMNGENASRQIDGYKFTKKHPFVVVQQIHLDNLLQNGFSVATPEEVREYYGAV